MLFSWNQIPLLRVLLPFLVGQYIAISFAQSIQSITTSLTIFVVFSFGLLFFLEKSPKTKEWKNRNLFGALLQLTLIACGALYHSQYAGIHQKVDIPQELELSWQAEVNSIQKKEEGRVSLEVAVFALKKDSSWEKSDFNLLVYGDSTVDVVVGDQIAGKSYIKKIDAPKNPAQFDYQSFMGNRNIYYQTFESEFITTGHEAGILSFAFNLRKEIVKGYRQMGIVGDELNVLKALTLGDKSQLSTELKSDFATAGAMHILAVSGLHVGIVFLILNTALKFLRDQPFQRWLKAILLLVAIWFFAMLSGFSPSAQRASWMFSFVILSNALKRNSNIINSIAASALLLILINPKIIFEVGFQLSYSAVIGIVLIHPKIYPFFESKWWLIDKVWSLMVVSMAAQIATLPLTIYYFHQFPNWFLITNLFAIPLAFLIVSGAFIVILIWLLFTEDFFLGTILHYVLKLLNYLVEVAASLPFPATVDLWLTPLSIILLYVVIATFVFYLYYLKRKAVLAALSFILILFLVELSVDLKQLHKKSISFYATSIDSYAFVNGLEAVVLVDGEELGEYDYQLINDHLKRKRIEKIEWKNREGEVRSELFELSLKDSYYCISAFGKKISFVDGNCNWAAKNSDFLILKDDYPFSLADFSPLERQTTLVLSNEIPAWSEKVNKIATENPLYFLSKDGFFEVIVRTPK